MSLIVGIDPGITGAIAAVGPSGSLQWVMDMPVRDGGVKARNVSYVDGIGLARILRPYLADISEVWIEEVNAMRPTRPDGSRVAPGAQSMFALGNAHGCIRGVVEALGLSQQRVHPRTWKAHYRLKAEKEAARSLARQLYPGAECLERKKDHGRAEAILIARYAAHMARSADSFLEGSERPKLELVA